MANYKDLAVVKMREMDLSQLFAVRRWLNDVSGEIGIHSASEYNKMASNIKTIVDRELWMRIVSDEKVPWK